MTNERDRFILLVTAVYAVTALVWIFQSDSLLSAFADIESIVWLSTAKGVVFVLVSAAGFFLALRAVPAAEARERGSWLEALIVGPAHGRLSPWLTYSFAVVLTLAMLALRQTLAVSFGERPLLILFMLPIILGALLGGVGPGLVATAVAAIGVAYSMPPAGSLRIAASYDVLQWLFLIVNGVAVSVLSEVLRRSRARVEINRHLLDAVVSGTPDAVFAKDGEGRYLLANAATAGFVGKPADAVLGCDDRALFPADVADGLMALDKAIMAAATTQTHEEQLTMHDGGEKIFLVTKGPLVDAAGQVVGLFGVARDITERKRIEERVRALNAELEQRVAERTADLESVNRELEDLAYAIAHNLRAPLRAINGFSQILIEDLADRIDEPTQHTVGQILSACKNMGLRLEGILALLRCMRGELQRETVDVSALARRRLEQLAQAEPQRQVRWQVAAGLAAVADRAMLDLALTHLLTNAWKFTQAAADASVRVEAGELAGMPGICVADNGVGFDMAHRARLFQPFQRLHRQDEFPGVGIGLATVERIVRRHGGQVSAVAAPGAGATFCFALPPAAAETDGDDD